MGDRKFEHSIKADVPLSARYNWIYRD
jgi:hypothetical protein